MTYVLLESNIIMTYVPGYGDKTALLTVRGKDNNLTVSDLRALAKVALETALTIEKETPSTSLDEQER